MQKFRSIVLLSGLSFAVMAIPLAGCEQKAAGPSKPVAGGTKGDGHDHKPGEKHDDHGDGHDHGATTPLGEQTAEGFTVKASRDGEIKAGDDAPIDVSVTGGTDKVATVRLWIGTQDGKGSVKAKAELEKDHWHSHVEIPSPMPQGGKLWVEIETEKATKVVVGFDLKS